MTILLLQLSLGFTMVWLVCLSVMLWKLENRTESGSTLKNDTYKCLGCGHHATYHEWDSVARISRPLGKCKYKETHVPCYCQNYLGIVPIELTEGR